MKGLVKTRDGNYRVPKAVSKARLLDMVSELVSGDLYKHNCMDSSNALRRYAQLKQGTCEHEIFSCVFLDAKHWVISYEQLFNGTIDACSVYPREVVKRCLALNAAAVIFIHNHPSGDSEPSQADKNITDKLTTALKLVDVRVLDHMVVSHSRTISFAERGLI